VTTTRKRKDASPIKAPPSKKAAAKTPPGVAAGPLVKPTAAPREELATWETVSNDTGWTPEDCLNHKLSFPKRCDPSKKIESLGAHVKRLRAAGWYLAEDRNRARVEADTIGHSLDVERNQRENEAEMHRMALETAEAQASSLHKRAEVAEAASARQADELEALRTELQETIADLEGNKAAYAVKSAELEQRIDAMNTLQQRLQAAETSVADVQKYASSLQEFIAKLQADVSSAQDTISNLQQEKVALAEEAANLRGKVSALGDALSSMQMASTAADAARQAALEEAARVRADLASTSAERASLSADATRLRAENEDQRKELDRFRAATGKELAELEAEKASTAALATRTQAQAATLTALQEQAAMLREQKAAAEALAEIKSTEARSLAGRVAELEALLDAAERRVRDTEAVRRRLHNTILELKGNVRVFCRVRPPKTACENENEPKSVAVTVVEDGENAGRGLELRQPIKEGRPSGAVAAGNGGVGAKGPQRLTFTFDRVFAPVSGQEVIFEEVSALVQSALDGYKVCLFAYGQTGAGKTHTMLGRPQQGQEGVIPRAVRQVFATAAAAAEQGWRYEMRAAMLEIYNEELRDLLGPGPPAGKKHVISHEDNRNGVWQTSISFIEWIEVNSPEKVASLLKRAMSQRAVGATACNEQSSRSHMVFMLTVEGSNETTGQRLNGALNLVDLAGSERLGRSGAAGDRLKETQAINKSLSALGDVIAALGAREAHVPYRNSKLTYLLQGSLSGAGKALMLCNVSPEAEDAAETLSTLRFASKVNSCEIGTARRNVVAS
jgi:kinesin family member C1